MENASKALLIAAGIFLAIMLVSLLVIGYNRISEYYNLKTEKQVEEQIDKFNKQFQGYNKKDLRGSELISLMNKVIDYNTRQAYLENYERIKVTITIGENNIIEQFMYNTSDTKIIQNVITNTGTDGNNYEKDNELIKITNTPTDLIAVAETAGINNVTDAQLKKLAMEISYILIDEITESNFENENRRIRAQIIKNVLKIDISTLSDGTYRTQGSDINKINTIKEIVRKYYQYTQFKRAKFECTEMKFDTNTGRVEEINFKVQTKKQKNGKEIVQFD